jgi:DNA-binding transcriptional regulator YiaG
MASTTPTESSTTLAPATTEAALLKVDTRGRVRVSQEQRNAILDEFERSGVSAAQFAKLVGLKYSTLAGWRQRYRRRKPPGRRPRVRLLEALVDPELSGGSSSSPAVLLCLPGDIRLEVRCAAQVPLAAALVKALQPPGTGC